MKRSFLFLVYIITFGIVFSLIASCTSTPATPTPIPLQPVKINASGFTVDGQPFQFIGANSIYFGFYNDLGLNMEDAIRTAKETGINVIRIYIWLGNNPWGGKPLESYDNVLALAAKYKMYVIVTLTDCTPGDWGSTKQTYLNYVPQCDVNNKVGLTSLKNQISSTLNRKNSISGIVYKNDPTILAWDIANEVKLDYFTSSDFKAWIDEMVSYVKQTDPNHLTTIGIENGSAIFSDGPHPEVFNAPDLDFISLHFYPGFKPGMQGVESSDLSRLKSQIETYQSMGKPVVLEEFGVGSQRVLGKNPDATTISGWILANKEILDTAFSESVAGAMFWGWGVPETKDIGLWWNTEDHDISETEFCTLIKDYKIPAAH
jgi:endo-1,4-beta-mannosidase